MKFFEKKEEQETEDQEKLPKVKIKKTPVSYQHVSFIERCRRFSSGERFKRFK